MRSKPSPSTHRTTATPCRRPWSANSPKDSRTPQGHRRPRDRPHPHRQHLQRHADLKDPPPPDALVALLRQIIELPKPVVARVTGHVRAGGLGLLAACDIAAASTEATFAFTEVRIGVAPAVISLPLLPRTDPRALARYYLTGERFDAAEATRTGLLTTCADDVDTALAPILDGLRKSAPDALAETKRLLTARVLETFDRDAADLTALSARLFSSPQAREGMTAFLERRDAAWAV